MMQYALVLKYFLVMSVLLLGTGVWMFILHTSLSVEGTLDYYAPKTFFGLLETVSPHLFAMAVLVFVLTHFFAIIKGVEQSDYRGMTLWLFIFMLVSNVSGFFIVAESTFFALVKLLSTLLFVLHSLWLMAKLYRLF